MKKQAEREKTKKSFIEKSPALYITMFCLWAVLAVFLWWNFFQNLVRVPFVGTKPVPLGFQIGARILLILNGIFISYFWLNGVKDFLYVVWYYLFRKKLNARYKEVVDTKIPENADKILLVYCTCNDFDGESLRKSMKQSYERFDVVILDDSTEESYQTKVNEFALRHGVKVVRREGREGFKAGNINHYLLSAECKAKGYGYYVILDSDEILPENYLYESLKYFYADKKIGLVQANHISDRNRNFFMRLFHIGVNSHWPTYQTMKHFYGFSTMLGHGAMIKRECYEKAGGFPPLVAEDLCLSIEARGIGYFVAFAPNILCREEYPVDYMAFKKRHSKWTQGNLEFIKKYTAKIASSNMTWFEKADIVLFTYNLPLTAIFAFFIFLNLTIAPLLRINLGQVYAIWMLVPTVVFFFSPMLNDFITWILRLSLLRNLIYAVCVIMLYGSMLTTSLISATMGLFGKKAKFIVTPKNSQKVGLWFALRLQWKELVLSTVLLAISLLFHRGFLPVVLIVITGYASFILPFFSNYEYSESETEKDDEKTAEISMEQNEIFLYTQNGGAEKKEGRPAKKKPLSDI